MKKSVRCLSAALCGLTMSAFLKPWEKPPIADQPLNSSSAVRGSPASGNPGADGEDVVRRLAEADAGNSQDEVWAAIERTLGISDGRLAEAPMLILQLSGDSARRWLARALYTRWAGVDASAALASASALPQGLDLVARESVLLMMVGRDPGRTLALTDEMNPKTLAAAFGRSCPVLGEWARLSPQAALAYVLDAQRGLGGADVFDDHPARPAYRLQTYTVLAVWLEQDPAAVSAWFRSLPDSLERHFIARYLQLAGTRFAPELTMNLASELPGSGLGRRLGFDTLAKTLKDADQALTLLPASRWTWETGLGFADMSGLGSRPPVPGEIVAKAARALLDRFPDGPVADGIRCGAAMRAGSWPDAAAAASRFPESAERAVVWSEIVIGWAQASRPAAEAWVNAQAEGFSREHARRILTAP